MMAEVKAPVVSRAPASANQKTMALDANAPQLGAKSGTQIIPDSRGVVAFAHEKAAEAREAAAPEAIPAAPAGALFWLAWIILGIGVGLGLHFWMAHKAGL
jgi:hypothetical protein